MKEKQLSDYSLSISFSLLKKKRRIRKENQIRAVVHRNKNKHKTKYKCLKKRQLSDYKRKTKHLLERERKGAQGLTVRPLTSSRIPAALIFFFFAAYRNVMSTSLNSTSTGFNLQHKEGKLCCGPWKSSGP